MTERCFISKNTINVMPVNTVLVHCSCIGGNSYVNMWISPVDYTFFPETFPGSEIIVKSSKYTGCFKTLSPPPEPKCVTNGKN